MKKINRETEFLNCVRSISYVIVTPKRKWCALAQSVSKLQVNIVMVSYLYPLYICVRVCIFMTWQTHFFVYCRSIWIVLKMNLQRNPFIWSTLFLCLSAFVLDFSFFLRVFVHSFCFTRFFQSYWNDSKINKYFHFLHNYRCILRPAISCSI